MGNARMVIAISGPVDTHRFPERPRGFVVASLRDVEPGQIAEAGRQSRAVRAEHRPIGVERTLVKRLGVCVIALVFEQCPEIV